MTKLSEIYSETIAKPHEAIQQHPFQQKILKGRKKNPEDTIFRILLNLTQLQLVTQHLEGMLMLRLNREDWSFISKNEPELLALNQKIENDIIFLRAWLLERKPELLSALKSTEATCQYIKHLDTLNSSELLTNWYTLTLATMFGGRSIKNIIRHCCYPGETGRHDGASYYSLHKDNITIVRSLIDELYSASKIDISAFLTESLVVFENISRIFDEMESIDKKLIPKTPLQKSEVAIATEADTSNSNPAPAETPVETSDKKKQAINTSLKGNAHCFLAGVGVAAVATATVCALTLIP